MKVEVLIQSSDEGFASCVPSMPGCWSQGASLDEAIDNIRVAVREYLEAGDEPPSGGAGVRNPRPSDNPALSSAAEIRDVEITD